VPDLARLREKILESELQLASIAFTRLNLGCSLAQGGVMFQTPRTRRRTPQAHPPGEKPAVPPGHVGQAAQSAGRHPFKMTITRLSNSYQDAITLKLNEVSSYPIIPTSFNNLIPRLFRGSPSPFTQSLLWPDTVEGWVSDGWEGGQHGSDMNWVWIYMLSQASLHFLPFFSPLSSPSFLSPPLSFLPIIINYLPKLTSVPGFIH
jgi:hypothetical protein